MKKTLIIGLVLLLCISMLAGCGGNDTKTSDPAPTPGEETPEPTPAPTPEPTPTPEPEPVLTGEEVTLEYNDATLTLIVPDGWAHKVWYSGNQVDMYNHEPPAQSSYSVEEPVFSVSLVERSTRCGLSTDDEKVLHTIDNKTIADADCEGLVYTHAAGDSFQYVGMLDEFYRISVLAQGFDADDPILNAILDNITFTVN